MAIRVAYEKIGHWARLPFLSEAERSASFVKMEESIGETLLEGLSQLRGTATKLGQILSLEGGLLPEAYRQRFESLQNAVAPLSYSRVRSVIKSDFGVYPEELFKSFAPEAFAAASVGQVHLAQLHSGEKVAVKIQYPGVGQAIQIDFRLLEGVLATLPNNGLIKQTVEELRTRLTEEVNYSLERDNQEWFRANVRVSGLVIAKTFGEYCGPHVLTSEFLDGVPLNAGMAYDSEVRNRIGQAIYDFFYCSLFELGVVHCDPHLGNYLWVEQSRQVGLLDFGAVKREFSPDVLKLFKYFFVAENKEKMLELYCALGAKIGSLSEAEIEDFYQQAVRPYWSVIGRFLRNPTYTFTENDELGRELRMSLVKHALHPCMQNFSGEFTMLHRALYGVFNVLTRLRATVNTQP